MVRITPAYAGNTKQWGNTAKVGRDHPRLRGEYSTNEVGDTLTVGSPPPTRGILLIVEYSPVRFGITPAYAGNTLYKYIIVSACRDHPRLRGEYYFITKFLGTL